MPRLRRRSPRCDGAEAHHAEHSVTKGLLWPELLSAAQPHARHSHKEDRNRRERVPPFGDMVRDCMIRLTEVDGARRWPPVASRRVGQRRRKRQHRQELEHRSVLFDSDPVARWLHGGRHLNDVRGVCRVG
eukprot:scaffold78421_cov63-Phaeocystis_antarctica.AAC.4